jgi:hypothetical protein
MKYVLTILAILICACSASPVNNNADELRVSLSLTVGERSKDSNSQTTTITVERDVIALEKTSSGYRGGGSTPSAVRNLSLTPADKINLIKLIRSNDLLVTDSIKLPQASSNFRYFEVSVDLTVGGKKGAINISGMRTAVEVKEKKLYQNTLALVKELYRIINNQNKSVRFEELILEPIKR